MRVTIFWLGSVCDTHTYRHQQSNTPKSNLCDAMKFSCVTVITRGIKVKHFEKLHKLHKRRLALFFATKSCEKVIKRKTFPKNKNTSNQTKYSRISEKQLHLFQPITKASHILRYLLESLDKTDQLKQDLSAPQIIF